MSLKNEINLPQELIVEILLRLPVKSVVHFKCVSKSWFSLLSDTHFANSHYELSASPTTHLLIRNSPSHSQALVLDLEASLGDDAFVVSKFHVPLSISHHIMGSCRGFILLFLYNYPFILIWNPSTGFRKEISHSPSLPNYIRPMFEYGFGYDASRDDYLIVSMSDSLSVFHLKIFSMRANAWKVIELTHFPYVPYGRTMNLLFNGAIHNMVYHDERKVILTFDLAERNFSEISLPIENLAPYWIFDLRVIGGCLTSCYSLYHGFTEIWVMKKYKVQSSWTKSFCLDNMAWGDFYPLHLTKGGEYVGLNGSNELIKPNDKGELLKHGAYCNVGRSVIYTASLLSLPHRDCRVAEEAGQQ